MATIQEQFIAWVLEQRPMDLVPDEYEPERVRFVHEAARAEVNLYPFQETKCICELLIMKEGDDSPSFYLHFMLDDLQRAEELFGEMAEALADIATRTTTRVLLCCSSALTTSYFAGKMNEAAQAIGLNYEFSAMSWARAKSTEDEYAAILLAPQVGHLRREMAEAHPSSLVFEIPGKVFGSYDAAEVVRLLMHALREGHKTPTGQVENLRPMRELANSYRILVITFFSLRDGARLGYRLYDRGEVQGEGTVLKARADFRDIEDLIETMPARGISIEGLDAIGIAVPGVTERGIVHLPGTDMDEFDLGPHLKGRFGLPVHVDNNCNAAAVACYVSQDQYESVVFFRQEFGHEAGGYGTVIDGKLLKGRHNLAGEPKYFVKHFRYDPLESYDDARWSAGGMYRIATNVLLAGIALTAPEAVYLAVDTVDDMDMLHETLAEDLGEGMVPPLIAVDDYVERVFLGEMALCAQKLHDAQYRPLSLE